MKRNNIRIAVQKDGRLMDDSLKLLESRGYKCNIPTDRKIIIQSSNPDVEIMFVRQCDIPKYVEAGVADFGILGKNVLFEDNYNVNIIEELGFGECSLVIAVPNDSKINMISDLQDERVATSYPNSIKKILKDAKVNASIIEIAGSVEAAPMLGLADAICDITQTGNSLKANSLRIIKTIFKSQAVFIESPYVSNKKTEFKKLFNNPKCLVNFDKLNGLIPAIIQDYKTNEVYMLGFMNNESLEQTIKLGKVVFWSRSRNKLWMKGEESGNTLQVKNICIDCDKDTLLIKTKLIGTNVCHTGNKTCFYTKLGKENI